MSLFDFFFPTQAAAGHLRDLAKNQRLQSIRESRTRSRSAKERDALEQRIEELEGDVGFVSLVLASLLAKLEEKGHIGREELRAVLEELDGADGVADGRLDVKALRGGL